MGNFGEFEIGNDKSNPFLKLIDSNALLVGSVQYVSLGSDFDAKLGDRDGDDTSIQTHRYLKNGGKPDAKSVAVDFKVLRKYGDKGYLILITKIKDAPKLVRAAPATTSIKPQGPVTVEWLDEE